MWAYEAKDGFVSCVVVRLEGGSMQVEGGGTRSRPRGVGCSDILFRVLDAGVEDAEYYIRASGVDESMIRHERSCVLTKNL